MNQLPKRSIKIIADVFWINLGLVCALLLRFDGRVPTQYLDIIWQYFLLYSLLGIVTFWSLKLYSSLWRYASIEELTSITLGVSIYCGAFYLLFYVVPDSLPRSIFILQWFTLMAFIGGSRFMYRVILSFKRPFKGKGNNVMIIGAGQAGSLVIKELNDHPEMNKRPVVVIDEDSQKVGTHIHSIPIVGNLDVLGEAVHKYGVDEIIIAMPSAPEKKISDIIKLCKETRCKLRRLPGIYKILDGKVGIKQIQDVEIEDLLGRQEIALDVNSISSYLSDQIVMVTGAGGSIGSELCRQIAKFSPRLLVMLDIYENNLYQLLLELSSEYPSVAQKVLIGSVRDKRRMYEIFSCYKPSVVFHAAAHKHVPLMEESPSEAIKNNIFGTLNVASAAHEYKAHRFVLISTDKAVNPTSVMGATKRVAEKIIQHLNFCSSTEFVAVRFGNVLGSSGSVIPVFKEQISSGGPVLVTHREVTRYFMTISEAVKLVVQAGAMAQGGEIFVLDMGEPVKIIDLARDLIRLSGFKPDEDISIKFTGLRPGEKLEEELYLKDERISKTCHEKIFVVCNIDSMDKQSFWNSIDSLHSVSLCSTDIDCTTILSKLVPEYRK